MSEDQGRQPDDERVPQDEWSLRKSGVAYARRHWLLLWIAGLLTPAASVFVSRRLADFAPEHVASSLLIAWICSGSFVASIGIWQSHFRRYEKLGLLMITIVLMPAFFLTAQFLIEYFRL